MKLGLLLLASLSFSASALNITVSAGPADRSNTPVIFDLPKDVNDRGAWALKKGEELIEIQILPGRRALFILPALAANQSVTYSLESVPHATRPPLPTDVHAKRDDTHVTISVGEKTMLRYNGAKTALPQGYDAAFARGGYLFPLLTPAGLDVADDYPPMHKHHHGLWFAWTKTSFDGRKPDFWNMGGKTGAVEFVSLDDVFAGSLAAGLSATHRQVDYTAKPAKAALNETWNVIAYTSAVGGKSAFVFDIAITDTCASDAPLGLPKYHYGGIGFRGRRNWNPTDPRTDKTAPYSVITSEGKDRTTSNESTATWCAMSGPADTSAGSAPVTFALIDHPANFRSPQPLRVHPTEPFFCYAPQQQGDFQIEPGKPYTVRYRAVIADGAPDQALLKRLATDWTKPVQVEIK